MEAEDQFKRPDFPFALGTTSFVYRDTYAANIERLAPWFDEIELLLFEGARDQWPSESELETMAAIGRRHTLSYNVHLPLDIQIGHADEQVAKSGRETIAQVMAHTSVLTPTTHTLHLSPPPSETDPTPAAIHTWQTALAKHFDILEKTGLDLSRISIENIMYPFEWVAPLVDRFKMGICFDVGHLWLQSGSIADFLRNYGPHIVLCHICGCHPDGLHTSLRRIPFDYLRPLLEFVTHFPHAVILEVFNPEDLQDSMDYLQSSLIRLAD